MTSFKYPMGDSFWTVHAEVDPGYPGNLNGSMDFAEEPIEPQVIEMTVRDCSGNEVDTDGLYVKRGKQHISMNEELEAMAIDEWESKGDSEEQEQDWSEAA